MGRAKGRNEAGDPAPTVPAPTLEPPGRPLAQLAAHGKHPPAARVRLKREFQGIQSRGFRAHCSTFSVIGFGGGGDRPRLGLAVSKRVGNAVVRNRLRRLIREVFRRTAERLPPVDLVVVAKPEAAALGEQGLLATAQVLVPALEKAARVAFERRNPRRPRSG